MLREKLAKLERHKVEGIRIRSRVSWPRRATLVMLISSKLSRRSPNPPSSPSFEMKMDEKKLNVKI